jgi:ATP-dependent 26S proteasome regulatory subunit
VLIEGPPGIGKTRLLRDGVATAADSFDVLRARGNELEVAYVGTVEATRTYRITNGELELIDASGRTLARFR